MNRKHAPSGRTVQVEVGGVNWYEYAAVPMRVFYGFPSGSGAGTFFTEKVRNQYEVKHIGDNPDFDE